MTPAEFLNNGRVVLTVGAGEERAVLVEKGENGESAKGQGERYVVEGQEEGYVVRDQRPNRWGILFTSAVLPKTTKKVSGVVQLFSGSTDWWNFDTVRATGTEEKEEPKDDKKDDPITGLA